MKFNRFFLLLVVATTLLSFSLPNRILKKVHKEIKKTFKVENFKIDELKISNDVNSQLSKKIGPQNLFSIQENNQLIGYAFIAKAPSKTDEFDYLILLDKELIIAKTKILIYREDYGGEIGSKRWLKQFIGKKSSDTLKYEHNIIAISGATISAYAMTDAVNTFLKDLEILHENKVL
jgi:hypothetical protein